MVRHMKIALSVLAGVTIAMGTFAYRLVPVSSLAAPEWDVTVIDERGRPVEGMTVRETWQNYSVEMEGHEADRQTDANGQAAFPALKSRYSVLRQVAGTVSTLIHFNVHASYGPHANVFAFGKGFEGSATIGDYVADWTGRPSIMRSRIIARPGP
jgi:hypothetical protein